MHKSVHAAIYLIDEIINILGKLLRGLLGQVKQLLSTKFVLYYTVKMSLLYSNILPVLYYLNSTQYHGIGTKSYVNILSLVYFISLKYHRLSIIQKFM